MPAEAAFILIVIASCVITYLAARYQVNRACKRLRAEIERAVSQAQPPGAATTADESKRHAEVVASAVESLARKRKIVIRPAGAFAHPTPVPAWAQQGRSYLHTSHILGQGSTRNERVTAYRKSPQYVPAHPKHATRGSAIEAAD